MAFTRICKGLAGAAQASNPENPAVHQEDRPSRRLGPVVIAGLQTVTLRRLVAGHAVENLASGRILSRLGFKWAADVLLYFPPRDEKVPCLLLARLRHADCV